MSESTDDPNAAAVAAALGTQYELVRLLGRGGMGAVYLFREPYLARDVAVKVLPAHLATGSARERFLREARTAARLSHPNIVPLYTFGQAGDVLYYMMGYVEGESLEGRLRREGRLPFDEVRRIAAELADALAYAHQMGVVHRDVKPDNVLLDRHSGRALLTDFGIAKQAAGQETLTHTGVVVGTPHYMSPEQASGDRDLDGRSDIYALGVVAYRMLTGRLPFEGSGLRDVLVQHATRDPLPPAQLVPGVPLDLENAITRALQKDPANRWPTAGALRQALSGDGEESLPDDLREQAGAGVGVALTAIAGGELAYLGGIYGFFTTAEIAGVVGLAVGVVPLTTLTLLPLARRFGWRTTLRTWLRQPAWWKMWWPRFARREGDVWDRLPAAAKGIRKLNLLAALTTLIVPNWLLFVMRPSYIVAHPGMLEGWFDVVMWTITGGLYLGIAYHAIRFQRWSKSIGIGKGDARRIAAEPTFARSFWSQPHIAALLSPSPASSTKAIPLMPADLLRDIERAARTAAAAHVEIHQEAVDAARGICGAIERIDAELAQLARDADPRERARVEGSLLSLGPESNESEAKRQMRALLERQLQLFQDLDVRAAAARSRRDHLVEQLRTLGLQLARLRAESVLDTAIVADITGQIQAVCRSIEYRVAAAEEVRALGKV